MLKLTLLRGSKMIKKLALFLATACLSVNVFAMTVGDLNSALSRTNQQTAQVPAKMIYGGRDVVSPKQAAESGQATVS